MVALKNPPISYGNSPAIFVARCAEITDDLRHGEPSGASAATIRSAPAHSGRGHVPVSSPGASRLPSPLGRGAAAGRRGVGDRGRVVVPLARASDRAGGAGTAGGKLGEAEARLTPLVRAGDSRARVVLARLRLRQGRLDSAVRILKPIATKDLGPEGLSLLGEAYLGLGDSRQAWDLYRELSARRPDDIPALSRLAELTYRHADLAEAVVLYRKLEGLEPKNPAWPTAVGQIYMEIDRYELAADAFRRALARRRGSRHPIRPGRGRFPPRRTRRLPRPPGSRGADGGPPTRASPRRRPNASRAWAGRARRPRAWRPSSDANRTTPEHSA